ncbi:MAG TPA: SUF system NifU family Fe-S cluster assembly protein [Candidatus Sulfotelmatobacter sp.]|nr:SUF system NifU family Fe-S cluster assembly protein [Candidatus Sulfotelmatobacter sp.]
MDELRELYQEVILDHGKRPRNLRALADATCSAHGRNPLCGDQLTVYLKLGPTGVVEDASFEGKGCAISVASASLMTELIRGKTEAQARQLFEHFHALAAGKAESAAPPELEDALERLQVLAGVRQYPVRVKCATLPWHTMKAALGGAAEVSTE